jgi:hypothetical protein
VLCVAINFVVFAVLLLAVLGKLDDVIMGIGAIILGIGSIGVILLMILIPIAFCCLPIIIAVLRKHSNKTPIILVSIFFSWTIIGWVIALIWAFTDNTRNRNDRNDFPDQMY